MILLQEEYRRRLSDILYNDTAQVLTATMLTLRTASADLAPELEPVFAKALRRGMPPSACSCS